MCPASRNLAQVWSPNSRAFIGRLCCIRCAVDSSGAGRGAQAALQDSPPVRLGDAKDQRRDVVVLPRVADELVHVAHRARENFRRGA
jgi:hypothetical protein